MGTDYIQLNKFATHQRAHSAGLVLQAYLGALQNYLQCYRAAVLSVNGLYIPVFKLFNWLIHCTELAKYRIIKIWLFKYLNFQMKRPIECSQFWVRKNQTFKIWLSELTDENMLSYDFSITFFILQFRQFKVLWCCLLLLRILEGNWGILQLWTNHEAHSTQISFKFSSFFIFSKWSFHLFVYYLYCVSYLIGSWAMCACVPKLLIRPQMIPNRSTPQ